MEPSIKVLSVFYIICTLLIFFAQVQDTLSKIASGVKVKSFVGSPMQCPTGKNQTLLMDQRKVCMFCTDPEQKDIEDRPTSCAFFYRSGPCKKYKLLLKLSRDLFCMPNVCGEDGLVDVSGECRPYNVFGPCGPGYVDVAEFEFSGFPICKPVTADRLHFMARFASHCPPGQARDLSGVCREVIRIIPNEKWN